MAKPMGLLVAGFNYAAVAEDEFNDWYDTEHVPERERIAGFVSAERWLGAEDPKVSVATYDLASLDVLASPPYRAIAGANLSPWSKRITGKCRRICRFEAEQILPGDRAAPGGAGGMLLFAMNVAPEADQEFNEWYNTEHVPRLTAVPGCLAARRFRCASGTHKYVALYHLAGPEVASSKAWEEAAITPWTLKIRPHTRDRLRLVLRRYTRKT
ncbi:MAG: hypothetical protein HY323_16065 [Betaproteobacteria bacterium]|nr:hypothetical protein [Betaproteobacteria bacterium]MBI3938491.1 hypothetical protein [Betaproteobacteria bacterium]